MYDMDDCIVSSRIRLARNIDNTPFPQMLSIEKSNELINKLFDVFEELGDFNYYKLKNISFDNINMFLESNMISRELIKHSEIAGLIISVDESVSIMVNEEDHLRMQCILKGLALKKAYDIINDIDSEISKKIRFAFDRQLGFLTACPTNVGTGMRASVMMFLPALTLSNSMADIIETVGKIGITVRGEHGEGSKAYGYLYQVSNQVTLGKSEKEIISSVENVVNKIYSLEMKARENLLKNDKDAITDAGLRAYGVLTNCNSLSAEEYMDLSAKVKLSQVLDLIKMHHKDLFDELKVNIKPYHIMDKFGKNLSKEDRDKQRALYVGRVLRNNRIY